jgi:hypothetical protein
MRWALVRAVVLAVAASAGLVVVVQLVPSRAPVAVGVWLLLLGALAVRLAIVWIRAAYPPPGRSPFDAALTAQPPRPRPPADLDRLGRLLTLSGASGLHAATQLRATLRPIAADRLAWYRGMDLDGQPGPARAALGEPAWALVRPDPGPLPDREAAGLEAATLADVIARLERLEDR